MPSATQITKTQEIIERHDQNMIINVGRYPIALVRGLGSKMWDAEGKEYLDLFAGFGGGLLGHCHPDLVAAVREQAGKLWHAGNLFHTEPQTLVAQAIAKHGFGGRSYFCHSGAEANEAAIKLARLYGKANPGKTAGPDHRFKIITADRAFHGRTYGAMGATGQEKVHHGFEPLLPGFVHIPFNDLAAIQKAIDDQTVAVMVEPIQGEGGINIPGDDYLPKLRELCTKRDILLICDEVWTGGGRTGKYFAHQHWNITPDIMTLAKGVAGGLPLGVMCAQDHVAGLFDHRKYGHAVHATTLGGGCIPLAASAAVFAVLERDHLLAHAAELGRHALDRLTRFVHQNPVVKQVRGKGLFIGIELNVEVLSAAGKQPKDVVSRVLEKGAYINLTQGNVLRLAPAVTITRAELDRGLDMVEAVLKGE